MVDLYNSNITDILPEVFSKKPEVQALGYAVNKAMQRLMGYCKNIGIYNSIDTLPERVLDLLAIEFNTQYYEDTLDIKIKRELIRNTFVWYTRTGTPAAVTEVVEAIFGNGEIEEWFQYGGEPYHFKVITYNVSATDEMLKQMEAIVSSVQNVRSRLEEVIVEFREAMSLYMGCKVNIDDDVSMSVADEDIIIYLENEVGEMLTNENGSGLHYVI